MLQIKTYKALATTLAASAGITTVIISRDEKELQKQIKEVNEDLFLVAVIPSSDTYMSDAESIGENDQCIFFVLQKSAERDLDPDLILDLLETTQNAIKKIKEKIYEIADDCNSEFHPYLLRIDFNTMKTDPEYDLYECNGYSMSFLLPTDYF